MQQQQQQFALLRKLYTGEKQHQQHLFVLQKLKVNSGQLHKETHKVGFSEKGRGNASLLVLHLSWKEGMHDLAWHIYIYNIFPTASTQHAARTPGEVGKAISESNAPILS